MEDSKITRIIRLDSLFASIGLLTQWLGAHQAHRHGLDSWHFGVIPFLAALSIAFVLIALPTFRAVPSLRVRILISTCGLWFLTAFVAVSLWIVIYGS
jgi:hypothetical protein